MSSAYETAQIESGTPWHGGKSAAGSAEAAIHRKVDKVSFNNSIIFTCRMQCWWLSSLLIFLPTI
jgi:hypothetical protein